nr:hypothetical protein Iba_chr05fCG15590 [Ipomoea batatas]
MSTGLELTGFLWTILHSIDLEHHMVTFMVLLVIISFGSLCFVKQPVKLR